MAAQSSENLILKILSGPHLGAEVGLKEGNLTIGREGNSDLVVNDRSVSGQHVTLTVGPGGCSVTPLDGTVMVAGQVIGSETPIEYFQVITLGTTNLAIGPSSETWPDILLPTPAPAPNTKEDAPAETEEEAEQPAEETPPLVADKTAAPKEEAPRSKPSGLMIWGGAALLVALLVVIAAIFLWPSDETTTESSSYTTEDHVEAVQNAIEALGITDDVTVKAGPNGQVIVSGYAQDIGDRQRIRKELDQVPGDEQINVYSVPRILQAVQTALDAQGFQVTATYRTSGVVVLQGLVDKAADFQKALNRVRNDVPGIESFDDETIARDVMFAHLNGLLARYNLKDFLEVKFQGDNVIVTGALTTQQQAVWQKALKEFDDEHGDIVSFESDITTVGQGAAPAKLQLDIAGISAGPEGYVALADGSRYPVGSTLPDGARIIKIGQKKLTLGIDDQIIDYEIPSDVKWIIEDGN